MSDKPTGVQTAGIGKKTAAHLNLKTSLADVATRNRSSKRRVGARMSGEERSRMIADGLLKKQLADARKARRIKFAGFDPHEIRLQLPRAE